MKEQVVLKAQTQEHLKKLKDNQFKNCHFGHAN